MTEIHVCRCSGQKAFNSAGTPLTFIYYIPITQRGCGRCSLMELKQAQYNQQISHNVKSTSIFRTFLPFQDAGQFQIQLSKFVFLCPLLVELLLDSLGTRIGLVNLLPEELHIQFELRRVVVPLVVFDRLVRAYRLL